MFFFILCVCFQARHKRLNLLTHPLVGSLLHYKWKTFAQTVYLVNLFSYSLFVAFITVLAMIMHNPQSDKCTCVRASGCGKLTLFRLFSLNKGTNQTGWISDVNTTDSMARSSDHNGICGKSGSEVIIIIADCS